MRDIRPTALLINPPIYDFALFDLYHKPYGLSRIGEWLKRSGYVVQCVDAMDYRDKRSDEALGRPKRFADGTGHFHRCIVPTPSSLADIDRTYARYGITGEQFELKIADVNPDLILIGTGMTYWYQGVKEAIERCRSKHPDVPIIIGGVYATCMPDHARRYCSPDLVVQGSDLSLFTAFLGERGLPVPDGAPGYETLLSMGHPEDAWVVRLNEGCPFRCDYCASPALSPHFHSGNAAAATRSVKNLSGLLGTKHVALYDDALLANADKVLKPFLEAFADRHDGITFHVPNALHGSLIDDGVAHLLVRAGFEELRIGFESPDPAFHRDHGGKPGTKDLGTVVQILEDAGFDRKNVITYVLAGLPDQTPGEVEEALMHSLNLGVRPSVAEFSPIPGSLLWERAVEASAYPIAEEPLLQNNSFFAMRSSRFTMADMWRLKQLSHGGD